jgi:hypothetical protein
MAGRNVDMKRAVLIGDGLKTSFCTFRDYGDPHYRIDLATDISTGCLDSSLSKSSICRIAASAFGNSAPLPHPYISKIPSCSSGKST